MISMNDDKNKQGFIKSGLSKNVDSLSQRVKSSISTASDVVTSTVRRSKNNKDKEFPDAVTKKNKMIFQNSEALQQVVNVINEASAALDNNQRTIKDSSIPEVLVGALGAGLGGALSFSALYGLGTVGLSAAGITSGLAAAGMGAGMVAGIGVLAAPAVVLGIGGYAIASNLKGKQLKEEKERLYKEALTKHQAIIEALQKESIENKERIEYLQSINVLLERAVRDLEKDLGVA